MKLWQYLALVSGAIIATVMALASISYNATLGTTEPAFSWLPFLSNSMLFASLALAFDFGMVASVFGFLHWKQNSKTAASVCAILFLIASLYSIHSVRGYIALNFTNVLEPETRSQDIYASLKLELQQNQKHLVQLRAALIKAKRNNRKHLQRQIRQLKSTIQVARNNLAQSNTGSHVSPLVGLDWFLAVTLWFFNATCWGAWFGYKTHLISVHSLDSVSVWLRHYENKEPQHCVVLFKHYENWCTRFKKQPLAQYSFYARLIELGAKKFREGRNGETKYELPIE